MKARGNWVAWGAVACLALLILGFGGWCVSDLHRDGKARSRCLELGWAEMKRYRQSFYCTRLENGTQRTVPLEELEGGK